MLVPLSLRLAAVEGPVEVLETDVSALQREIAVHYLGERRASAYLESFAPGLLDEVMLVLHPERWWTVDFSKLLSSSKSTEAF